MANTVPHWPGWEILKPIGKGGFGSVYEIQRDVFGDIEKAALKVISIPHDDEEIDYMRCQDMDDESISSAFKTQVADFIKEYTLMARMRDNINIVHCDDFRYLRHENDPGWDIYLKMELLTPLMKTLDRMKDEQEIIRLGIELCNALMACQKHNIIHRDIKPQNIFISPEGHYKLGDFGIARTMEHTTRATGRIGTFSFMAPEVEAGKVYNARADIYSLGLVLYWLLNERRAPFVPLPPTVPTTFINEEAKDRRCAGEPIPAPVHGSDALKAVVLKACAFDPDERFQDARAMMDALKELTEMPLIAEKSASPESIVTSVTAEEEMTVLERRPSVPNSFFISESVEDNTILESKFESVSSEVPINASNSQNKYDTAQVSSAEPVSKVSDVLNQENKDSPVSCDVPAEQGETKSFESAQSKSTENVKKKKVWIPIGIFIAVVLLSLTLKNGWYSHNDDYYYYRMGIRARGDVVVDGVTYSFNQDGVLKNGWYTDNGEYYYYEAGQRATGFRTIQGKQFYFDHNGVMCTD